MAAAARTPHRVLRRGLFLAVLLLLLAPLISATPASATVVARKCSAEFSDSTGFGRVCVQYDGSRLNGVLDWVVSAAASNVRLDVGLWQCRGIDVGCPTSPNVTAPTRINPTGHVFVATPLLAAAGGHYYQACGESIAGRCTPFLAINL